MSKIEELYYEYISDKGILDDLEVKDAIRNFDELLEQKRISEDIANLLSDARARCCAENERQGFIYGFKYAVKLMSECYDGK